MNKYGVIVSQRTDNTLLVLENDSIVQCGLRVNAVNDLVAALRIVAGCVADEQGGTTLGSYEMGIVRAALAKAGAL